MRRFPLRRLILITIIVALAGASIAFQSIDLSVGGMSFKRGGDTPLGLRLGLDLQGGSHLVYQAQPAEGESVTSEKMDGVIKTIERRVNAFGVTEPLIQRMGGDRVLVQLPGIGVTKATMTFQEDVETGALRSMMAELGRPDAVVEKKGDRTFTVELPSLRAEKLDEEGNVVQAAERDLIEQALKESFGEGVSYAVTGGVEEAKRLIGETARLEFKERTCLNDLADITQRCEDPQYHIDEDRNLGGNDLARAYAGTHPTTGVPVVNIEFKSEGTRIFAEITQRLVGTDNRIAIFLDGQELLAPVARQAITGGRAFIEGPDFTAERVRTIAIQLESGRLPVPLTLIQEQDVDATLGKDSLGKSVVAGLIGLGLVLFFMTVYYRLPGVLASITLTMYAVIVLAIFKLWPVTLTLAGMAALILSVGMAVDANVLIFERMKEELRSGRTLIAAIETGFNRAWPSIRDSNVSTFITCAILFWFGSRLGTGMVTGFAVILAIGVAVSMFSALTVTRTLLRAITATPLGRFVPLYTPVGQGRAAAPLRSALGERR